MNYGKFPLRMTLDIESYNALIEALKGNEIDYEGSVFADDAKALREKIENHGRRGTDANGVEVVRLGFYENEGKNFVWQFIAAAILAKGLQKKIAIHEYLSELSENLVTKYKRLIEMNECVIEKQDRLLELVGMDIADGETESGDDLL